ncbi:MAG TPA: TRM11 family methyltransferase [Candidatus Sulfotelmatobacter sp.]|nr:TRM11 family methyltransferase [Candidatus Sulfotelmatobacter sp.]
MAKLFFLLSGEYESLSFSELKAILEVEGYTFSVLQKLDQTARIEVDEKSIIDIQRRSAYTRVCALELFTSDDTDEGITKAVENTDFRHVLKQGETFEVRIRRIKEYSTKNDTMRLERELGKLILQNTSYTRVNLTTPGKTFFGVLTNHKLIFGLRLAEIEPKPFVERRPRKKPFFHPSAMNAKLARCMVNLAHALNNKIVLDPFCGTGTTILEAALIGCTAIGADVQRRMVVGTQKNLLNFGVKAEALVIADARQLPFTEADAIITDPPYGKSATTLKSSTRLLVLSVLSSAKPLLHKGQRICIALPIRIDERGQINRMSEDIADFVKQSGYNTIESHMVYVHRSLTREIMVYERL